MKKILITIFLVALLFDSHASAAVLKSKKATPTPKVKQQCLIKGNISIPKKEKIYHLPGCGSYKATVIDFRYGERWFCTEKEARSAGWRKALNCPK